MKARPTPLPLVVVPEPDPPPAAAWTTLHERWDDPKLVGPLDYALGGLLVRGGVHLLYAAPKVGKTTFAAHLALAIAAGTGEFASRSCAAGPVLWHDREQGERTSFRALREAALAVSGGPPRHAVHVLATGLASVHELLEKVRETDAQLVVIDTATRYFMLDDNNDAAKWSAALGPWVQAVHAFRDGPDGPGPAWVFIDHARKSGGEHGAALAGSYAKFSTVDAALHLRREEGGTRRVDLDSRFDGHAVWRVTFDGVRFAAAGLPAPLEIRLAEERAVLTHVRAAGEAGVTIKALAAGVGKSRATVMTLLDRLLERGAVMRRERRRATEAYRFVAATESHPTESHPTLIPPEEGAP
jgi:DNA-binding transcriptional ArsR family regulator